jgi:hypothetical protein
MEVQDALSSEEKEWVTTALKNSAELFLPAAKLVAKKWLQGLEWVRLSAWP